MSTITESITIDHPVPAVYAQWTQFEDFPKFMEGIERIDQLDDRRLHWVADFGGEHHEWDAEITEQLLDQRIAWRSIDGKTNTGAVSFKPVDGDKTEISLEMEWEPEGLKEKIGGALGFDTRQVKGDLKRFDELLDARDGQPTGDYTGEVR